MRKIVDCFLFFNEANEAEQLLKCRLKTLDPIVDIFVLVESDAAFAKLVQSDDPYIRPFLSKIRAFNVQGVKQEDAPLEHEAMLRNGIALALKTLSLSCEDIILLSNVDEIPKTASLHRFINSTSMPVLSPHVCDQQFFYYSFEYLHTHSWQGTNVLTYGELEKYSPQHLRSIRQYLPRIADGGCRCSHFGNIEYIKTRIPDFSHQDYNTDEIFNKLQKALASMEESL